MRDRPDASAWSDHGDFTVVVPIHGELPVTIRFLESWERQTRPCPLLFVDDRSPDESVTWLRARGYVVLEPEERLWFNGIVNLAVRECRTPLIGILNNDLVLGRRFVELSIEAFQRSRYDFLVPRTRTSPDRDALDATARYRIVPIREQEG